jgi:hypothetical protein
MLKLGALDQLPQVHELNRAFLGLLQSRARQHGPCLGLPTCAEALLAGAGPPRLEAMASFPHVLFQIRLSGRPSHAESVLPLDEAEHELCLLALHAARNASRQSAYQARLLYGLEPADVQRLGTASLTALQQLAAVPGVLQCAFSERRWFWEGLFTATRPELRRQLTLMALQPAVGLGWPPRRPPHLSI